MNAPVLPPNLIVTRADGGQLLKNLAVFSSLLRRAGFGCGMRKTAAAADSLSHVGLENRSDVFWALAAVFVERKEQLPMFRRAFDAFWRIEKDEDGNDIPPEIMEEMSVPQTDNGARSAEIESEHDINALASDGELLGDKDFARMTEEEWQAAMQINRRAAASLPRILSRRKRFAARGKLDMRRTVRRALARGGEEEKICRCLPAEKTCGLIVLLDISGSMTEYSRAFLHFVAGMFAGANKLKTRAFLLGTRLTEARSKTKDAQAAARQIAASARDWDGGTRLTPLLREFNQIWLRRIGASSSVVLFVTDGLEVNFDSAAFTTELERLQKSCRKLVWLNPLLRYDAYEPLARGAQILSRQADETRPIHNVRSVLQLASALGDG